MNQARDIRTGDIIDAESLKYIYEDGLSEYECIDDTCRIKLLPCSYKPTNKKRPYFKSAKGETHTDSCKFSEYLKLLEKGRNRALTEFELEDMPFPTKLKRVKQKKGEDITHKSISVDEEKAGQGVARRKASGDFIETFNKSKVVSSISPIVDFYIKCPSNRDEILEIDGDIREYMYWFKRIEKPISRGNYNGRNIFFGRLHTNINKIVETETTLEITLYECEGWEKNPSVQINPFIVTIDKSGISKHKLSRIKSEINYAVDDKKEAFINNSDDKKKHAYIFFLGEAPKDDKSYKFIVNDGLLVARYTQIYPTINKVLAL